MNFSIIQRKKICKICKITIVAVCNLGCVTRLTLDAYSRIFKKFQPVQLTESERGQGRGIPEEEHK